jgi:hypothetical protein
VNEEFGDVERDEGEKPNEDEYESEKQEEIAHETPPFRS